MPTLRSRLAVLDALRACPDLARGGHGYTKKEARCPL